MQLMLIVTSQENAREFVSTRNGQSVNKKAIDLVLTDGLNNFLCTAFGDEAQRLIDHPLEKGSWCMCDLSFAVNTAKTDKGDRAFQSIYLNKYIAL